MSAVMRAKVFAAQTRKIAKQGMRKAHHCLCLYVMFFDKLLLTETRV
jgi:hypothetical protein